MPSEGLDEQCLIFATFLPQTGLVEENARFFPPMGLVDENLINETSGGPENGVSNACFTVFFKKSAIIHEKDRKFNLFSSSGGLV